MTKMMHATALCSYYFSEIDTIHVKNSKYAKFIYIYILHKNDYFKYLFLRDCFNGTILWVLWNICSNLSTSLYYMKHNVEYPSTSPFPEQTTYGYHIELYYS